MSSDRSWALLGAAAAAAAAASAAACACRRRSSGDGAGGDDGDDAGFRPSARADEARRGLQGADGADPGGRLVELFMAAKFAVDTVHADKVGRLLRPDEPRSRPYEPGAGPKPTAEEATMTRIKEVTERAFFDVLNEDLAATPPSTQRVPGVLASLRSQLEQLTPGVQREALARDLGMVDWADVAATVADTRTQRSVVAFFMERVSRLEAPATEAATKARTKALLERVRAAAGDGSPPEAAASLAGEVLRFVHAELGTLEKSVREARRHLLAPVAARDVAAHVKAFHAEDRQVRAETKGFPLARAWLHKTVLLMVDKAEEEEEEEAEAEGEKTQAKKSVRALPTCSLSVERVAAKDAALFARVPVEAVLRLVLYPLEGKETLPETLALQKELLRECCDAVQATVLAAAAASVCGMVTRNEKVPALVAEAVAAELAKEGATVATVGEEVCAHVDGALLGLGRGPLATAERQMVTGMLTNLTKEHDKLYATYHARLVSVVAPLVAKGIDGAGHASLAEALKGTAFVHLGDTMLRLVAKTRVLIECNVAWYRAVAYDALLADIAEAMPQQQ